MSQFKINFVNSICFLGLIVFAAGFQSTFWFQIFGSLPAPWVWLDVILYLILFRRPIEGIGLIYGLTLFVSPFTSMRLGVLWMICLIVFSVISFAKKRVFWPGFRYFFFAALGANLLFQLSYIIYSFAFENNPGPIAFFQRLGEILVSSLLAIPVYSIATHIDQWTDKEFLPEAGGAKG